MLKHQKTKLAVQIIIISPGYYLSLTVQEKKSWLFLLWFVWRSDLSHLRDKYTKTIPHKTFDFSSFIWHISCALFAGRFWLISPNEMSTCHGSNQFPDVTIVARKIGKEFTWQKECTFVWGWGNTSKCCDSLPDRKQTLMLLSRVCSISFHQGICQLSQFILSVCACRVRFTVSTTMSQKSVDFCELHSSEPFPTVLKFF